MNSDNGNNNLTTFRSTWYEQRDWGLEYAMQALSFSNYTSDIDLFKSIDSEIMSILHAPHTPAFENYTSINTSSVAGTVFNIGNKIELSFDSNNGAINYLYNIDSMIEYANKSHLIGEFIYQTLTETNFINFIYNYSWHPWDSYVLYDFGKHLLDEYCSYCQYQYITSTLVNFYENKYNCYNNTSTNCEKAKFIIEWQIGNDSSSTSYLHKNYGIPSSLFNEISIDTKQMEIDFEITWINKTATRIPETLWFKMNPNKCSDYEIDKLGESVQVGPGYILNNGSFHLHATTGNVSCSVDKSNKLNIESIDSALVGFIPKGMSQLTPFPIPFANVTENGENAGFGFVLYDNIWGTNYPVWYPFDQSNTNHTYRFSLFL